MIEIFSIFKSERASHLTGQPSLRQNPCITMNTPTPSIASLPIPVNLNPKFVDRTGHQYGNLFVIGFAGFNFKNQANWICRCLCGNITVVFSGNLNNGHTTSCGCKRKNRIVHGENRVGCRSDEYSALHGIIQRCTNPNHASYDLYGGRGIKCFWKLSDLKDFVREIGRRPTKNHSVDRINSEGHYEPGNVRWATAFQQTRNTSRNVWITFRGETLCRKDMAEKYGLNQTALKDRLATGWSIEDALLVPVNPIANRGKFRK